MPELPDIEAYLVALEPRVVGQVLSGVRIAHPFLVRTVDPPVSALAGRRVTELRRLGKRIVFGFEGELFCVLHLMVAGRLQFKGPQAALQKRYALAGFDFAEGTLVLTEAGKKRRASLHVVRGEAGLEPHDRGGLEVMDATLEAFTEAVTRENHTLKRTLTDPRLLSGIGNAYSDEILHRARLSPIQHSQKLSAEQLESLWRATREVLGQWCERLGAEARAAFPEKVTAFRPEMAVHGKHGQPCPVCAAPVQRIVYASNETNYCPGCQTGGRVLADRALSRLLKADWPRSLDELERLPGGGG